jgi:hypothetical protein
MNRHVVTATVVLLMSSVLPALAQTPHRATKAEQDACQADVFRVCDDAVPDEKLIVACLNKKLPELSAACQRIIEPDPAKRTKQF